MSRIKCLIIDDEPHTASVLESYISEMDALEHVGTFYHAIDALMYLQRNKIDLVFLDIMLPKVTGEAFLKMLPCRPRVVFLSNKKTRWSRGGDDYILDCLVKPIAYEDFLRSVERCYAAIPPAARQSTPKKRRRRTPSRGPFIYLFSGKATVKVFIQEVLYIESVKNCSKITTTEKEIVVQQGLTALEARFAARGFMRIHRSLIVATSKITAFNGSTIELGVHILPVGAPYRGEVDRIVREAMSQV